MNSVILENLKAAVKNTGDIQQSLSAIEECATICKDLARNALDAFLECPDDGFLIAERLLSFGSIIEDFAWEGYNCTSDESKRTLLVLILYKLKFNQSEDIFIRRLVIESPAGYLPLLINSIREDTIPKSLPVLTEKAKQLLSSDELGSSFESNPRKDALVAVLHVLKSHLPSFDSEFDNERSQIEKYPIEVQYLLQTNLE